MDADELDEETLVEAEREALDRPEPSSMFDERLYTTHGLVHSWADRGDDLVAESNHHVMLARLREVAGPHRDDIVIEGSMGDWAFGSLREIFVQIRTRRGAYTRAFREAVALALYIRDFVVLDDSDHSDREQARFDARWEDAVLHQANQYMDDTDVDNEAIAELALELVQAEPDPYAATWDMDESWSEARNAYFEARARERLSATTEED